MRDTVTFVLQKYVADWRLRESNVVIGRFDGAFWLELDKMITSQR
jgi:hypothetical protein